ncbi:arsenite efflux MFS transporter ArsK [Chelatococcus daeguensis]|uniref:arsenite efflux MFS transporter ArsK n=1 Tax=Chelatococcus daeguensis TaxID=444444 RepID=UPI0009ECFED3|nr:arsenite efflux MFS transporter ArsK [Chelatococcus daeguensis]MBM3082765.1 arsenite efflux MFS transporter ArsK [Chelatococcus daeguensis]
MRDRAFPVWAIWALGLTQITGYGTLYYSFPVLAPAIAREFTLSEQWIFAALSASLLAGSLLAPTAGRWMDRVGAAWLMTIGSAAAALALVLCALAPGRVTFVTALLAMELTSCFVLYGAAFAAIVQAGSPQAQRSITHLTLIAGFASTLFWPLTSALHAHLSWREVYGVFAALNLGLCMPIHWALLRIARRGSRLAPSPPEVASVAGPAANEGSTLDARSRRTAFLLMLAGFAIEGFVLSALLMHMVPLMATLGLGAAGLFIATLFGPAQVASRLVNMLFGGRLAQTHLATVAAGLLTLGVAVLAATAPWLAGAVLFAVLFGLGSGLISIVSGTLPLELFGRDGYGARLGWVSAARQFTSALGPFAFALLMSRTAVETSLWSVAVAGLLGLSAFVLIDMVKQRGRRGRHPVLGNIIGTIRSDQGPRRHQAPSSGPHDMEKI